MGLELDQNRWKNANKKKKYIVGCRGDFHSLSAVKTNFINFANFQQGLSQQLRAPRKLLCSLVAEYGTIKRPDISG